MGSPEPTAALEEPAPSVACEFCMAPIDGPHSVEECRALVVAQRNSLLNDSSGWLTDRQDTYKALAEATLFAVQARTLLNAWLAAPRFTKHMSWHRWQAMYRRKVNVLLGRK